MAYANLPADDDVDDAPPVTITRVGGGYSGVRSPKTAPSPAARTPAVDDDDRHRRRGDRRRPSTAATARDRTRDRRAFDPSLTKQLAHKEAALRFELERVRAQNATLVAENDGLRVRLEDARRRFTATEGDFVLQSHELDRARERALGEGARRVAELEDRCDRQRRTLQELAVASEALAKDNVALSDELVALRDSNEENETKVRELTARLSSAQRLYLAGQKSLERAEELREATAGGSELERKLDALLTPEMLARSRPPPSYPAPLALPVDASSSSGVGGVGAHDGVQGGGVQGGGGGQRIPGSLISDRQRVAEENSKLKARLEKAERRVVELGAESREANGALAELRKATAAGSRRHNAQLTGALRRLQWLVERQGRLEAECEEKDAYAKSLERRLLSQHKTLRGVASAAGKGAPFARASTVKGVASGRSTAMDARGKGGRDGGGGRGLRASAAALLRTPETPPERSSSRYRAGGGGWVTGVGRRTPEARAAIALSRRAMAMNASPTSAPAPGGGDDLSDNSDDPNGNGSDPDADADAAGPRRLDWGPGSSAFNRVAGDGAAPSPGDERSVDPKTRIAGVGAIGIALESEVAPSDDEDAPRRPEWVHAPAKATTSPGTAGSSGKKSKARSGLKPSLSTPREASAGDDMSMEAIQDYIAQLQNLHERSAQLASSGGGEVTSESPLLMGD